MTVPVHASVRIGRPPQAPSRLPYWLRIAASSVIGVWVAVAFVWTLVPIIDLYLLPVAPSEWLAYMILAVGLLSSLFMALATPRRKTRRPGSSRLDSGTGAAANPRMLRHSFPGARGRVTSHSLPPRSVT